MSIYPVPLQKWFPIGNTKHSVCKMLVKLARCEGCGKHCKFNRAWGHHALPYGYGVVWCSKSCLFNETPIKKRKASTPKIRGKQKKELIRGFARIQMPEQRLRKSGRGPDSAGKG